MSINPPTFKTPPDLADARRHVAALTGKASTSVRARMLYERHKNSDHEAWKLAKASKAPVEITGTITALWPQIEGLQKAGYAAFIVVNEGNCAGEFIQDEDITTTRANFIDCDGTTLAQPFLQEPDFSIRRDKDHVQIFWCAKSTNKALWRRLQLRLAAYYGTDSAVCNPSRVMRLAGSLHLKTDKPILI